MYRTYAIRSAILSLIVNLGFLWLVNDALSADYVTVQVGQSKLQHVDSNGWWYQFPYADVVRHEESPTWTLGLGWHLTDTINVEFDYRDLGKYTQLARHVNDNAFDAGCFPCGQIVETSYGEGRVYGFGLSATYAPVSLAIINMPDARPYGRLGLFAHHSSYMYWRPDNNQSNGVIVPSQNPWNVNRIHPFLGYGVTYKDVFVEVNMYKDIGTDQSAFRNAKTLTMGFRKSF